MRTLILWNLLTLDGYFEGARSWDLDWHDTVWNEELERFCLEQLHAAEMLLFGRVTYEGMAAYWRTAEGAIADLMNGLPKIVFSRTLRSADWQNTTLSRDASPAAIRELKRRDGRTLFVFGSGALSSSFVQAGLFDEYRLLIAPVILGKGTPLFGRGLDRRSLKLLDAKTLTSGGVLLRYAPR